MTVLLNLYLLSLRIFAIAVIAGPITNGVVNGQVVLAQASQIHSQPSPSHGTTTLPSFEVVSVKPYPHNYWPAFSY
jgi:hypothetical protein